MLGFRERVDVIVTPILDLEGSNPRRIEMVDDSNASITLTLWDDDADDDEAIEAIMNKPMMIRNGLCHYCSPFNEWQIKKRLCAFRKIKKGKKKKKNKKITKNGQTSSSAKKRKINS